VRKRAASPIIVIDLCANERIFSEQQQISKGIFPVLEAEVCAIGANEFAANEAQRNQSNPKKWITSYGERTQDLWQLTQST